MPEETNNTTPTWANFKPPVMTTPYGSGGNLNMDGTSAPSTAPTDPITTTTPPPSDPTPTPIQDPLVTEMAPTDPSSPDPLPTETGANEVTSSTPISSPTPDPMPASDPAPVTDPVPPSDPAPLPPVTPSPIDPVSVPSEPTPAVDPDAVAPTPMTTPQPTPTATSPDNTDNSWSNLTPTSPDPVPAITPAPVESAPFDADSNAAATATEPVVPAAVLPTPEEATATPAPLPPAAPVKKGSKLPLIVGAVALVALVVAAGAYLYLTKFAAQPASTLGAQTTADNQAILNASLGPASWDGNYSSSLSSVERGGLELVVTDPAPAVKAATATATPAVPTSRTDIALLKVKIGKAEVHLTTQTVEALSNNLNATKSANRTFDRWETLRLNDNTTVDLMDLRVRGGALSSLGVSYLVAGHYTELRLYITQASVTFTDGTTKTFDLTPDNGIVKIARPFDVSTTGTATFLVDFDAPASVSGFDQAATLSPVLARILYNGNPL